METNKIVEINQVEGVSHKIIWIYQDINFFANNSTRDTYITFKRQFYNDSLLEYGNFDEITNIKVQNNKLTSFHITNCLDFDDKLQEKDFCKKIGFNLWEINSFTENNKRTLYINEETKKCFNKELIPVEKKFFQTLRIYLYWANFFLNIIKLDTFYEKIFLKKVVVFRQDKKNNPLIYRSEVNNFLLCCNKIEFLPELIPEVLKFISFI